MGSETITINPAALENSMFKLLVNFPSRDLPKFADQQFKGVVSSLIRWTPPGSRGASGSNARRQGERAVTADVFKVFTPVPKKQAKVIGQTALAREHNQRRNARGRVPGKVRYGIKVPKTDLRTYVASQRAQVGTLADGWTPAAAKWNIQPPAWITRHNSAGSAIKRANADRIFLKATNRVDYASRVGMEKRVNVAAREQSRKLDRRLKYLLETKARQAGFRISG